MYISSCICIHDIHIHDEIYIFGKRKEEGKLIFILLILDSSHTCDYKHEEITQYKITTDYYRHEEITQYKITTDYYRHEEITQYKAD